MDVKVISRNVGLALLVSALFMFLSLVVSIMDGMDSAFGPLAISFIITLIVGSFPFIFVRTNASISLQDGFLIIVLSWMLSFVFGMLPYVLWGGEFSLVNAWFESVSGYTTTGSTILTDVEALPRSLLFWRSSTHFIGGLGVVVFLLLVMPDTAPFRLRLTNIELSSLSREGYRYKSSKTVFIIAGVYTGLAIVETFFLCLAGMSLYDAVNHSFSTVATGGFSTRNLSVAYYDSFWIELILMVFMTLSAMHFGTIFTLLVRHSLKPLKTDVVKYYLGSIAVMSVLIIINLMTQGGYKEWWKAARDATFQVVSFITTTGFGQADNASWPFFSGIVLMFAAFQCGCSGSTAGGVKADRLCISFKAISNSIQKRLHPSSVCQVRLDNHQLPDSVVISVLLYIVLYGLILFVSTILLMAVGVDVEEAFSGSIASLGNVGPGLDSLGTMGNYSSQPFFAKIIYSVEMILGRVEIFPIFIVFSMLFHRKR